MSNKEYIDYNEDDTYELHKLNIIRQVDYYKVKDLYFVMSCLLHCKTKYFGKNAILGLYKR